MSVVLDQQPTADGTVSWPRSEGQPPITPPLATSFLVRRLFQAVLLLASLAVCAPQPDLWFAFTDSLTDKIGFKNASNQIKIPAQFSMPTSARIFRHVVAVQRNDSTAQGESFPRFFLRRDGTQFGLDSVPLLPDIYLPCEAEGKILFMDPATKRFGYFDATGRVAIPARFVQAGDFQGGFAVAMETGTLLCSDGKPRHPKSDCEHASWSGIEVLIDPTGQVIANPFAPPPNAVFDWSDVRVVDAEPDTNRIRIPLLNGKILSVADRERTFRSWFFRELPRWTGKAINASLFFPTLSYPVPSQRWKRPVPAAPLGLHSQWQALSPRQFLRDNRAAFTALLDTFRQNRERLSLDAYDSPLFADELGLLDDCGHPDTFHHPAVTVTWDPGDNISRRELQFVRTTAGYRIVELD